SQDVQAVLATDKVRFQGQEVAFVIADDRYSARDALELIDVEYEPLPVVMSAVDALTPSSPLVRDGGNRRVRPRGWEVDAVVHDAGAARAPDDVLADHGAARAQDPRDLARRRRR